MPACALAVMDRFFIDGLVLMDSPYDEDRQIVFVIDGAAVIGGLALLRAGLLGVRRLT